ncbi:TnsD family transposase [Pseudomonas chlororaphis subsp. piscium]|nr:TnsD family transposase [Pseudomonas chlororaphis subsp. piscium]
MEGLLFFPQPFPDESLYSLAVRYHRLSANPSYRVTSQELFGAYSRTCGSILPCCLEGLSQRLGAVYPVKELIDRFTLLPLYRPFMDHAKYSAVSAAMAGNCGTGLKMSLGITASRFLKHASFRYCESCVREDVLKHGAAYWHRVHQAIGTCICPLHNDVLWAMTFPNEADWRCMLLPAEAGCTPVMQSPGGTAAGSIAEMQLWGLENPGCVQTLLAGDFLRCRLDVMGFIQSGRIRERLLRAFLGPRLLCGPSAPEFQEIAHCSDWVFRVLRPRGVVQPLKFYFLCWLLALDLEQLKLFRPKIASHTGDFARENAANVATEGEIDARRSAFSSSANLKCHEKPGYLWLYRHDREWLAQYVAAHPFIRSRRDLTDWDARDSALARELSIANDRLRAAEGKPQKVTPAALCRLIAYSHGFLRKPNHFPKSIAMMKELIESTHNHQIRKIKWAIGTYRLDERCAKSVVYRFSGIRVPRVSDGEYLSIIAGRA